LDWITPSIGLVGVLIGALIVHWFEERKLKKQEQITLLKESIDRFYSPLLFHFENMKSWGKFQGSDTQYVFALTELQNKLSDMYLIMKSGIRLASPEVRRLWYEWQPYAVAEVEYRRIQLGIDKGPTYGQRNPTIFNDKSTELHEALKADYKTLNEKYATQTGLKLDKVS